MAGYQSVQLIGSVFLGVAFVTGMCGNYLVISSMLHVLKLRSATNCILVNLAVADILGCLLSLPIMTTTILIDLRHGVLKILSDVNFVSSVSIGGVIVSCHILLCIDRYQSIVSPFNQRTNENQMKKMSVGIWSIFVGLLALSIVLALLVDTHWLLVGDEEPHFVAGEVINGAGISVVGLTLLVMLYTFGILNRKLKRHATNMSKITRNPNQSIRLLKEQRLLKVALIIVLSFAFTTFPWIVVRLLYAITGHASKEAFIICYSILYSGHTINPFVYGSFMTNLRREMKNQFVGIVNRVCVLCRRNAPAAPGGQ